MNFASTLAGNQKFNLAAAAANAPGTKTSPQAVVDYLVKAGLPAARFTAVGYGSTQPVADNESDEGKAQNRRIEFLVR